MVLAWTMWRDKMFQSKHEKLPIFRGIKLNFVGTIINKDL